MTHNFFWTDDFLVLAFERSLVYDWTRYIKFKVSFGPWRIWSDLRVATPSGVLEYHRSFLWWYDEAMMDTGNLMDTENLKVNWYLYIYYMYYIWPYN